MPQPPSTSRLRAWPYPVQVLVTVLAVGAAHGLGSWFFITFQNEPLYVIWPGVGVGLAALHLFGRALWPWLLVGGVGVQAVTNGHLGFYTWLFPIVDTLEAWLAVTLLTRAKVDVTFPRVEDVARYIWFAALVPTLVSASLGLSTVLLSGDTYYHEPITWMHWWLADLQGMLHVGTVLLTWTSPPAEGSQRWPAWTLPLLVASVAVAGVLVGTTPYTTPFAPALYMLPVALVLAAAVGHGPRGATLTSLVTTASLVLALPGGGSDAVAEANRYAGLEIASLGLLCIAMTIAALMAEVTASGRAREAMAAQLAEAERLDALGRIAAGVAHDFNNLLTAILGNASLLRTMTPEVRAQQLLREVEDTSHRAAELCRQMLAVGGLSHRKPQSLDLAELVEGMARVVRSAAGAVDIHFDLHAGTPRVEADATQLRQVLMNLVVNAAEACAGRSEAAIIVRVAQTDETDNSALVTRTTPRLAPGPYVRLDVVDTGTGMDAETAGRIFDPFFTTKFTGRGLGLSVVLGIVRAHGAGIAIESRLDEGTVVMVLWPVRAPALASPLGPADDAPRSVLVIDADPDTAAVTARMLRQRDGMPVIVPCLDTAVTAARDATQTGAAFDALLLDDRVPATASELGILRQAVGEVPCLVAARHPDVLARLVPGDRRGVVFLEKPFGPMSLRAALAQDPAPPPD